VLNVVVHGIDIDRSTQSKEPNWDKGTGSPHHVLNILNNLASVTIRVLQSGHSRELDMMRSEQLRHIARCLFGADRVSNDNQRDRSLCADESKGEGPKSTTYPQSTMAMFASSS
jgi:hypothetical protein